MDEQRLNELNAMRDSIAGGETTYNAIRFNSTQEAPIPYDRFTNFINQTAHIEEQRDNSWAGTKFVKAFANGFLIAPLRGLWGNLEASADANLIKQLDDEELAKLPGVEKVTRETIDAHFPMIERLNVQADSTVGQYVYALVEGVGQMVGQYVVNMATGPIGGGVAMFSQVQGNQYADLRQQGVSPDKAFKYSVGNAAIQSALEQISFGKLFKALPKDSTTRQKVKEVMEGVISEGFTEFLQDLPEKLSNYGALQDNEGKTTFETALSIAREWDSNYIDNLKDMVYSGSIGAIIGGGAKGLQIAMNHAAEKYILKDNITKIQEQAKSVKANGLSAKQAQTFIDSITGGTGTVNLDAQQVREFAYNQNVSLETLANDLGTTQDAITFAADNGLDITVSQGAIVANYDKNGFGQAMEPHMSFGDEGKSVNYFELQRDLEKTYGESSERQQSLKTELDDMEKSMLDAGIPQEQAKQGRALASAFAVAMNPEAPAEFLKKYKVRFSDKAQAGKGLFQNTDGNPRGQFSPQTDGTYVISMFKGRNASTVVHETGHYFYEVFMQESGLEDASPKLKKDRAAFLSYVGMTEEQWTKADFERRRAAHERVATAFEQYLLEGKAPSKGLRGVFSRFSKWLKAIYGEVVQSPDYAGLTDDVREAFDHWLAADADIEQAMKTRGIYGKIDSKLTGILSDKQRAWLEDQIEGAKDKAVEILTKEYMSNFSSERKAAILQYKADIEKEVREQVAGLRVNQARVNIADLFTHNVQKRLKYILLTDQQILYTERRIGKPIEIANNYLNWAGQDRDRELAFKSIQNEIDACLKPELTVLERGFGNGVRWAYVDNKTGQEISFNEAQARDKARPGYKYKPVSENAKWYQLWFKEHGRQPNKGELLKLAEDLYCGIDKYHVYGDLLDVKSAEQKAELEAYAKKNRAKLDELYAERDKMLADDKYLGKRRPKLSDDLALAFENLAEELGYSSGSEMAQDILNAKTEERMVQDAIRARVKEKFPDYAQERALAQQAQMKALYDQDEGGMVAALEQQLIEEAAQQAFDRELTAQEQAAKQKERIAKAKEMKAAAEVDARKMMLEMSMDEGLKANRFAMQERRAAANAKKAIKKGDLQEASRYKYQQMVLHALVRHSLILKQEVERTKKFVKRLRKTKKDMAHFGNERNFNQIAHLLYRLGVGRKDYSPEQRTESLQEYIDQMTEKLGEGIPEIAPIVLDEGADIKSRNLTIEQYEQVRDSLQNLMAIVKNDVKSTLDEKAADFEDEKGQVLENLNKLDTVYVPSAGGVEVESFWKRQIAQRQNLDNFLEMMDKWTYGYFSKTFGNALKHCADKQAELKMEFDKAMSDAMKKWCPTKEARRQVDQEHYYEELKANANKHTLVNMLIHLGNESSMRRLCETRMVDCEQSGLWVIAGQNNNYSKDEAIKITRQNLLDFLSKNLTKSDVEYAQAKVDAVNKLWPLLAEVNLRTKGFAPRKVEATPVAFKPNDGDYMTFQGGYYPLARDSRMGSMRQGQEAMADTENNYTPTNSMSTVQSTSKARTGAAYPVKLSYGYEFDMIEDTIHDIAYRETMMAFNKLLKDEQVYSTLKQKLGVENFNLLRETLWKCARPKNVQDAVMAERSLISVASWIRRRTVNAVIACNLKVAMQNFGNIFLYGNTVDGFTQADVLAAMPNMFSSISKHKAMREEVFELSPFMRERSLAPDFAMKEVAEENQILKNYKTAKGMKQAEGIMNKVSDTISDIEEGTQKLGARMLEVTDNITAVPVWLQAYHKQLNMGKSQQEAIDFADTVIRRTLGSNRLQDVASIMRGGQMYKLFTAFQSFFNTQFNQWYREANIVSKSIKQGEYKEAFMRAFSFALSKWLLACLANVIIGSASFIKPFEKDEKDWREINKELITYPISMTGGPAGQVAMYGVQSLLGMQSYGYRLSIIENTVQKVGSFLYKANSVAQGKKEANELIEPAAEIISIAYGIPLQFVRTGGNFFNIAFDDMSFELEDIMNRRRKSERNR